MQSGSYFAQYAILRAQFKERYSTRSLPHWAKKRSGGFVPTAILHSNQTHEKDRWPAIALDHCL